MTRDDRLPEHKCPGTECRGQFFWIKYHGMICTLQLVEMGDNPILRAIELEQAAKLRAFEGLGLA